MIVVDSSALLAVIQIEPVCQRFLEILGAVDRSAISAVTLLETGIVLRARRGEQGVRNLMQLIEEFRIDVVPFDGTHARLAIEAFGRYGKGINPRSRLNLGDFASYALARSLGAALLFKGNDFRETYGINRASRAAFLLS